MPPAKRTELRRAGGATLVDRHPGVGRWEQRWQPDRRSAKEADEPEPAGIHLANGVQTPTRPRWKLSHNT